jgi:thiamine-monophosphate kinase
LASEFELIDLFKGIGSEYYKENGVIIPPGDDCAIIDLSQPIITSVDASVAGVHFPLDANSEDIAYRSIAVALSDLAAMGAYPSFISIGLTANITEISWYKNFTKGIEKILNEYQIKLIGGDVTFGEINICVNVFGYPYDKIITRSGAKINDSIFLTGPLGKGRKGLMDWKTNKKSSYVSKFFNPIAQFINSEKIVKYATSCIDISDGLIKDLGSICKLSGVGADINVDIITITNDIDDICYGDDYELCFTCNKKHDDLAEEQGFIKIGLITDKVGKVEFKKIINQ